MKTLTERAIETLGAKMEREWAAYHNAKAAGCEADARELLGVYNETGFRLAKLRMRLKGE